jgi:hypothetical protein
MWTQVRTGAHDRFSQDQRRIYGGMVEGLMGLNEIIGATRAIEGSAYWIALVVSWMQTLGSQPVMPKISPIIGTRGLPKP